MIGTALIFGLNHIKYVFTNFINIIINFYKCSGFERFYFILSRKSQLFSVEGFGKQSDLITGAPQTLRVWLSLGFTFSKCRPYPAADCSGASHAASAVFSIQRMLHCSDSILQKQLQPALSVTDTVETFTPPARHCTKKKVFRSLGVDSVVQLNLRPRSVSGTAILVGCVNPLKTKRRLLHLKTQFVPHSKHFSSRL